MEIQQMIASRIKELCARDGISTNKLLLTCGINTSFITDLRKGKSPSTDKVVKIAQYFNVSTDYLLGMENTIKEERVGVCRLTDIVTEIKVKEGLDDIFVRLEKSEMTLEAFLKRVGISKKRFNDFKNVTTEVDYPTYGEFEKMYRFFPGCGAKAKMLLDALIEESVKMETMVRENVGDFVTKYSIPLEEIASVVYGEELPTDEEMEVLDIFRVLDKEGKRNTKKYLYLEQTRVEREVKKDTSN